MSRVRTSTVNMRELWLSFMGCAVRMGWAKQDTYTEELSLLRDSMDEVLCDLWFRYRAEDTVFFVDDDDDG